jgi:hypothetical protein
MDFDLLHKHISSQIQLFVNYNSIQEKTNLIRITNLFIFRLIHDIIIFPSKSIEHVCRGSIRKKYKRFDYNKFANDLNVKHKCFIRKLRKD